VDSSTLLTNRERWAAIEGDASASHSGKYARRDECRQSMTQQNDDAGQGNGGDTTSITRSYGPRPCVQRVHRTRRNIACGGGLPTTRAAAKSPVDISGIVNK
jgi:hypothetical protein